MTQENCNGLQSSLLWNYCIPTLLAMEAMERTGAEDSCSDVGSLGLGDLGLKWDAIGD